MKIYNGYGSKLSLYKLKLDLYNQMQLHFFQFKHILIIILEQNHWYVLQKYAISIQY